MNKMKISPGKIGLLQVLCFIGLFLHGCTDNQSEAIQIKAWEKHTLTFKGPETSESADENPFLSYRLNVTFKLDDRLLVIPGFYASDGNAAQSGSDRGNAWKVHFRPDQAGLWTYKVSFRKGENIATSDDPTAGTALSPDGTQGEIDVLPNPNAQGKLVVDGGRYLKYAGSGKSFIKGGADSPENFLAYEDFDGTVRATASESREGESAVSKLHSYSPHIEDWRVGDPEWQNGKGKGMIGALNYLAGKGMNSVYFLTMNIEGDGKDVWPYTSHEERFRFDCSKLDQWEIVFDHMDRLGLMLHIVLQETENETLLDGGDTGPERKLYCRELIARFAHHLGVTWNMGEENGPANFSPNGQNTRQQKAMVSYVKQHDPYKNYTVIHSHAAVHARDSLFTELLGFKDLDGMSLQAGNPLVVHDIIVDWLDRSAASGHPWMINTDEIGHSSKGVLPDDVPNNNQDTVRSTVLWGTLMAGGGGVEWYFGWKYHDNDLECENWRSRDQVWDYTRYALNFFNKHLPFSEMGASADLIESGAEYCFAKKGEVYALYAANANGTSLNLSEAPGQYEVLWYNPRVGGELQKGSVSEVQGGEIRDLGDPPKDKDMDWAILVRNKH